MKTTERLAIVNEVIESLTDDLRKKIRTSINLKEDIDTDDITSSHTKITVVNAVKQLRSEAVSCSDDHDFQKKMLEISTSCSYTAQKVAELERLKTLAKNAHFEQSYSQVDIGCIVKLSMSGRDISYILLPGGNGIVTSQGVVCTLSSPIGQSIRYLKIGEGAVVNGRHYGVKSIL